MSKELVISANRHETRVAVLEDDQVVEVFYQRENEYSLAGSIHKGRVTRVLPGMQSAFVDIGLGRDAFLYVSDFFEDNDEYDKIVTSVEEKVLKLDRAPRCAGAGGARGGSAGAGGRCRGGWRGGAGGCSFPRRLSRLRRAPCRCPPVSRETGGATAAAIVVETAAAIAVETGVAIRAETGAAGARAADAVSAAAAVAVDAACRRPNTIRRGPRRESRHQASLAAGIPEAAPVEEPVSQPRVVFDPEQDDFFVLPGESLAKYTGGHAEDEPDEQPAAEAAVDRGSDGEQRATRFVGRSI